MRQSFRQTVLSIIGSVICLSSIAGCDQSETEIKKTGTTAPNIFLIVLDAASAQHFGCYGCPVSTSPNIDRLASESILFENAYSQTSSTLTSTASLFAGVRATTHFATSKKKLSRRFPTLAQRLKEQGFKTYGFIGNPFAGARELGLDRGYDECIQVYQIPAVKQTRAIESSAKFTITLPEDINEQIFGLLPSFEKSGTFAYIHYLQPHKPYDPPKRFREGLDCGSFSWHELHGLLMAANEEGWASAATIKHSEARYLANMRYVDAGVGALMHRLREAGQYDESLIILMSDHGDAFFKHHRFGHNWTVYDDMTRIPLLFKFPKSENIKPRRIKNLVETIDVISTIFDYLGIPIPYLFEGDSLWPIITQARLELEHPEVVICTHSQDRHAIRIGKYKYIANLSEPAELYDLNSDPDEQHNIIQSEQTTADLLDEKLISTVKVRGRKMPEGKSHLRADPRMDQLLRSLGYVGEVGSEDNPTSPTSRPAGSSTTQPAD